MLTFRERARGRVDWDHDHFVVAVTAPRPHSRDTATIELRETEWRALPPVRQAVTQELERLKPPVRADITAADRRPFPDARTEPRDGRNWVVLARRAGAGDIVAIEMSWKQWISLAPVQWMIGEAVDREREAAERERREIKQIRAKLAYAERVARQGSPAAYVLRTLFLYSCFFIVYLSLRVGFDQLGYPWGYPTLAEMVAFGTALFIAGFWTIFMSLVIAGVIARVTRRSAT